MSQLSGRCAQWVPRSYPIKKLLSFLSINGNKATIGLIQFTTHLINNKISPLIDLQDHHLRKDAGTITVYSSSNNSQSTEARHTLFNINYKKIYLFSRLKNRRVRSTCASNQSSQFTKLNNTNKHGDAFSHHASRWRSWSSNAIASCE